MNPNYSLLPVITKLNVKDFFILNSVNHDWRRFLKDKFSIIVDFSNTNLYYYLYLLQELNERKRETDTNQILQHLIDASFYGLTMEFGYMGFRMYEKQRLLYYYIVKNNISPLALKFDKKSYNYLFQDFLNDFTLENIINYTNYICKDPRDYNYLLLVCIDPGYRNMRCNLKVIDDNFKITDKDYMKNITFDTLLKIVDYLSKKTPRLYYYIKFLCTFNYSKLFRIDRKGNKDITKVLLYSLLERFNSNEKNKKKIIKKDWSFLLNKRYVFQDPVINDFISTLTQRFR